MSCGPSERLAHGSGCSLDEARHRRRESPRRSPRTLTDHAYLTSLTAPLATSSTTICSSFRFLPPLIRIVSIDSHHAYRQAIQAQLPAARIVVDHFHLVRRANTALDAVRRERQRERLLAIREEPAGAANTSAGARTCSIPATGCSESAGSSAHANAASYAGCLTMNAAGRGLGIKEAFRSLYRAADRGHAERRRERSIQLAPTTGTARPSPLASGVR